LSRYADTELSTPPLIAKTTRAGINNSRFRLVASAMPALGEPMGTSYRNYMSHHPRARR